MVNKEYRGVKNIAFRGEWETNRSWPRLNHGQAAQLLSIRRLPGGGFMNNKFPFALELG